MGFLDKFSQDEGKAIVLQITCVLLYINVLLDSLRLYLKLLSKTLMNYRQLFRMLALPLAKH